MATVPLSDRPLQGVGSDWTWSNTASGHTMRGEVVHTTLHDELVYHYDGSESGGFTATVETAREVNEQIQPRVETAVERHTRFMGDVFGVPAPPPAALARARRQAAEAQADRELEARRIRTSAGVFTAAERRVNFAAMYGTTELIEAGRQTGREWRETERQVGFMETPAPEAQAIPQTANPEPIRMSLSEWMFVHQKKRKPEKLECKPSELTIIGYEE